MPTISTTNFNIVCATLGGFITIFGLVSYLFKERLYLSEPLISLVAGIIFSPHATNLVKPLEYAQNLEINLDYITLYFTRLVLGVQLVLAGVQLPSRYLWTEWKALALLLGPGMTIMWVTSSLLIWGMVPHLKFVEALAVAACITPTDPVLSNSIVKVFPHMVRDSLNLLTSLPGPFCRQEHPSPSSTHHHRRVRRQRWSRIPFPFPCSLHHQICHSWRSSYWCPPA